MPLQATSGAASYDAFGGGVPAAAIPYIEDVFSCFLYAGTGASQTITNNLDLSTKGGLVWIKSRSDGTDHRLTDTARGATKSIASNSTAAEITESTGLTAFGTTGFTIGADADYNTNAATYASWTFREQEKFFDVVTYTGNGVAGRTIAHNLGAVPGCIIVKRTSASAEWVVYHRSLGATQYIYLDSTDGAGTSLFPWNNTSPTSSVFTLGDSNRTNSAGETFVAYIFAHDAGGFGLTGTDNVISCGSYTGNGSTSGPVVTLGYEPQWLMVKKAGDTADWLIYDSMRNSGSWGTRLNPNLPNAENSNANAQFEITSTGFYVNSANNSANSSTNTSGITYIYIAIRRGPMKVPTVGTSVFTPIARSGTGSTTTVTGTSFPPDLVASKVRTGPANRGAGFFDRLRGATKFLVSNDTGAEQTDTYELTSFNMNGYTTGPDNQGNNYINEGSSTYANWIFGRAPNFFDVVCYTGDGSTRNITHNLTVVPELFIVKRRDTANDWYVYSNAEPQPFGFLLNTADRALGYSVWNNTTPTSSVFTVTGSGTVNGSGGTYVAYLFATCAGVSKVGSYTGNGSSQTINCGFTSGSRFVLIKRIDASGGWHVWDSARGIIAGNDPYVLLNTATAEVTTDDSVDTDSTGFVVNQVAATNINVTSATYIFLAIA